MAFDLTKYINRKFDISDLKTAEDFRDAANTIIQNEGVFGGIGNSSPVNWAKQVLSTLSEYDKKAKDGDPSKKQRGLFVGASPDEFGRIQTRRSNLMVEKRNTNDPARKAQYDKEIAELTAQEEAMSLSPDEWVIAESRAWLSGSQQQYKANRFQQKLQEAKQEAQKDLDNTISNIANRTDFSGLSAEQLAKEYPNGLTANKALLGDIDRAEARIQDLKILGIDVSGAESAISSIRSKFGQSGEQLAGTSLADAPGITRTESGFQPTSEVRPTTTAPGASSGTFSIQGGQAQSGPSPIYYDQDNPGSLYYIPAGQTQPVKISNPAQLQELAQQGLIESNKARIGFSPATGITPGTAGTGTTGTGTTGTGASELPQEINDAIDKIAEEAANSDMVYSPKISPTDIQKFIEEGIAQARIEDDQYFSEIIGRTKEAYMQGMEVETKYRQIQLEQESINRQQELKQAQEGLEASGATFSGEASSLLGAQSALPPGLRDTVEGLLQKSQRMSASTSQMRFAENLRNLTTQAEERLGTQAVQGMLDKNPDLMGFANALLTFNTPTPGSITRERETQAQLRGREIAQGNIAQELATSGDFPTDALFNFI